MMKKLVLGAAVVSAVMAAAPAHAALVSYTTSGTTSFADAATGDTASSSFSDGGIRAGHFSDTLKFTTGLTGETIAAVTITSFSNSFSSLTATLNGIALTAFNVPGPGHIRVYSIDVASLVAGTQKLVISGNSLGHAGYSGSISAPIPEPSTWALSILGFGLIGGMLRSRRQAQRQRSSVLFAA